MSLLCGLAAARDEILQRQGGDVRSNGLFGAPPFRVVLGDHARRHPPFRRALADSRSA